MLRRSRWDMRIAGSSNRTGAGLALRWRLPEPAIPDGICFYLLEAELPCEGAGGEIALPATPPDFGNPRALGPRDGCPGNGMRQPLALIGWQRLDTQFAAVSMIVFGQTPRHEIRAMLDAVAEAMLKKSGDRRRFRLGLVKQQLVIAERRISRQCRIYLAHTRIGRQRPLDHRRCNAQAGGAAAVPGSVRC